MTDLKKMNYIIEHKNFFQSKGVNLMYDKKYGRYEELAGKETDYLVITFGKLVDKNNMLNKLQKYHKLELIQFFYPTQDARAIKSDLEDYLNNPFSLTGLLRLKGSGPFVEIYKII